MATQELEFYAKFIELLKEKFPERGKLADVLSEKLCIEKESVYRRLRGDVSFTLNEIVKIAKQLNISLDQILGIISPYRTKLFQLHIQDYFQMDKVDHKMNQDCLDVLHAAGNSKYSELGFATSVLPLHSSMRHPFIFRFYLLKWMYQFSHPEELLSYSQIEISEKLKEFHRQYLETIPSIKYTYIIWDELFMVYLINDIQYFHAIRLLTDEDIIMLKEDISLFLDHLETFAIRGAFTNGNKLDMYVSGLNFETSYSYLVTDKMSVSIVEAFTLGYFTSLDKTMCDKQKLWMRALKRTSTLITGMERARILFFEKQRELLEQL